MIRDQGFSASEQAQVHGAALALSLAAALAFLAIFGLRLGLGDTARQVASLWLLCVLPLWLSAAATRFADMRAGAAAMMTAFLTASLLPAAALWLGSVVTVAVALLLLACVGLAAGRLWRALRANWGTMLIITLVSALLLIVTTLPGRFLLPEQLLLGFAPSDEYFHTALAGMVVRYHRFAIGADGLAPFPYHFLSHVIAAGSARAAGTDVPRVYLYWGSLTLKLQLLWAFFLADRFLRRGSDMASALVAQLAYAWLAVMAATVFESESYVAGAAFAMATLPFLLTLEARPDDSTPRLLGVVLLALAATLLCTAAKLTSGFFICIALALAGWRMRGRIVAFAATSVALATVAVFTWRAVLPRGNTGQSPVELLSSYNQYLTWQSLFSYLLPLLVLGLYLWRPRLSGQAPLWTVALDGAPPRGLRGWWNWISTADPAPQCLAASLTACLLVLVAVPIGSNIAFFSLILLTMALLLLPQTLEAAALPLEQPVIRYALAGLVLLCCLPLTISFAFEIWVDIAGLQVEAQLVTHVGPQRLSDSIRQSLRATHRPFTGLKTLLDQTPMARLRAALAARDAVAVHVDAGNDEMWRWLQGKSPHWCMAGDLSVPSLTNVVELLSFAPKRVEMECSATGANYYAPPDVNQRRSRPVDDAALCRMAASVGARRVYVLASLDDLGRNRDLVCTP